MKGFLRQFFWAVLLVLVQIFVVNGLQLRGAMGTLVVPSIWFFYILIMPLQTSRLSLLLVSFAMGIVVDSFFSTLGVNAAAGVLVGYLRPFLLPLFISGEWKEKKTSPSIYTMGIRYFFYYVILLSFLFHFLQFFLEVFSFNEWYFTLLRILLSSIASAVLMMLFQFLFAKKNH
ncbi:hypothetical protein AGMMS4956_06500 [Bacteroidia bacterium]|nr:hypothetical protein AGMMS4956_06500 [Bacteroidia bacterium]